MTEAVASLRQKLKTCNLPALFIEELGWNHHRATPLIVEQDGHSYVLSAVAEKHGMVAYECQPGIDGRIPNYVTRGKIDRKVAKSAHEHIVIFVDRDRTTQTWQWVRREKGKPSARREHTYTCGQTGDSLIQKLQTLMISIEEEEKLTIVDVLSKTRQAFDVDRVTKRFYERFKDEHKAFLSFIQGIEAVADCQWYASLMLNRLMFIYFIQKKGFLDGDMGYLRHRLEIVRGTQGSDKFHSFYRAFLCRLFHEGLGQRESERTMELKMLLGKVPYLNGGLFDTHQLEAANPDIQIPDEAFERLFDFFDDWEWHLDIRINRPGNEINPDVLGYIFEKYINQKDMGAYYTKEDITEYISKSTIVPFLFDIAAKKCAVAFQPGSSLWRLLKDDPDHYIYNAVKKGVDLPLPADIEAGIGDMSKRSGWNRPANDEFALPTETWREHVARRTRCLEVRAKLAAGEIHSINDFITYNLDLRQFAQDAIAEFEGTELLAAFYQGIEQISVLDPTCGSGAFLFAALNILEPLYEACLDRMEVFVGELDSSGVIHHPEKYSDFRKVLDQANDRSRHPSRSYFILKSIVLKNLYGVDIMAEAVEICKLRLFLKLVAQVERFEDVEPLPDIDFNIRAGNTLVGFTSLEAVKKAMTMAGASFRMLSPDDLAALTRINESAELADKAFTRFREQQTEYGMQPNHYSDAKGELQARLANLRDELNRYLATDYGVNLNRKTEFDSWRESHQPFHWFVEFYRIMVKNGGFDVIIGNPPYVEYSQGKFKYNVRLDSLTTSNTGNLYAFIYERTLKLAREKGFNGIIVPISSTSTPRMEGFVKALYQSVSTAWISIYAVRPSKLFVGVDMNLTIIISKVTKGAKQNLVYTTTYLRWNPEYRDFLFKNLCYVSTIGFPRLFPFAEPKIRSSIESSIMNKILSEHILRELVSPNKHTTGQKLCYRTAGGRYYKIFMDVPFESESKCNKVTCLSEETDVRAVLAVLSSNLWWWYYTLHFDMYNCKDYMIFSFPFYFEAEEPLIRELSCLGKQLVLDLQKNAKGRVQDYATTGSREQTIFNPSGSKHIIDEIDRVLAKRYGFTEEELDFIINYDIKYRMSAMSDAEE
ncbi:DNA methyltransferase [Dehalogenimonas sp. THU2]|uniref:Eco57I restriction-modification methylase domain-containing protein n=1 Tax=Dehalogenimonas sp. THU2 TaxID=3151121 RepID=UPI003218546E